jgi:hypothetical protein
VVHDDTTVGLDGVQVKFDDHRVVSDAGVMPAATLAGRLGLEALAGDSVRLRRDRAGAANAGRKDHGADLRDAPGADSIDDCGQLRAGRTRRLLGGWIPRPRRLGARSDQSVTAIGRPAGAQRRLLQRRGLHDRRILQRRRRDGVDRASPLERQRQALSSFDGLGRGPSGIAGAAIADHCA